MRRLRVQLTVLLALLGMLVLAWGAAIFLGARDAARSSASIQSTVDRVDELRRAATGLSREFVAMETSRRAYLLTGDRASRDAGNRAEVRAVMGFKQVATLSQRWRNLPPLVSQVAAEYRAWVRTGQTEVKARERGAAAAAQVARRGNADRHFLQLCALQAKFEDQLARSQYSYARNQDRTYATAQALAVRTALMMLAALVLLAVWLRRAVGAPADALRSASGRLAGGDLETPVTLGVDNELGAVASDLETMRRRLAGRMEALERLRHLSAQVVGATSLQRLAEVALAGLQPEVGATRAILGAARPAGDLVLRALAGFPDSGVADDIVKADAEIRHVLPLPSLRAGQVVGLADLDEVATTTALHELVGKMGVRSLALVPLLSRGRFLGLLALCWTERHQLDREQEAVHRNLHICERVAVDASPFLLRRRQFHQAVAGLVSSARSTGVYRGLRGTPGDPCTTMGKLGQIPGRVAIPVDDQPAPLADERPHGQRQAALDQPAGRAPLGRRVESRR
jgi:CHASE3 domain sensor protein